MSAAQVNAEILNDVLVIHVTEALIPFQRVMALLKQSQPLSGVVIHNKVPDYIPDQHSISYLIDIMGYIPAEKQKKLAIIPFTHLQRAMFEIVLDEINHLNVKIDFFTEIAPALSWICP